MGGRGHGARREYEGGGRLEEAEGGAVVQEKEKARREGGVKVEPGRRAGSTRKRVSMARASRPDGEIHSQARGQTGSKLHEGAFRRYAAHRVRQSRQRTQVADLADVLDPTREPVERLVDVPPEAPASQVCRIVLAEQAIR